MAAAECKSVCLEPGPEGRGDETGLQKHLQPVMGVVVRSCELVYRRGVEWSEIESEGGRPFCVSVHCVISVPEGGLQEYVVVSDKVAEEVVVKTAVYRSDVAVSDDVH